VRVGADTNEGTLTASCAVIVATAGLQISWDNAKRLLLLADKYDVPLITGEKMSYPPRTPTAMLQTASCVCPSCEGDVQPLQLRTFLQELHAAPAMQGVVCAGRAAIAW
jgi:hypothetical protein